jgi:hypothetical protein
MTAGSSTVTIRTVAVLLLIAAGSAGWFLFFDGDTTRHAVFGAYRDRYFLLNTISSLFFLQVAAVFLFRFGRGGIFRIAAVNLSFLLVIAAMEGASLCGIVDFRTLISAEGAGKDFGSKAAAPSLRWSGRKDSLFEGDAPPNLVLYMNADAPPVPFRIETDRFGLRNPPGKGAPEVFLLGDSFLQAALTPAEETVTERLERRLGVPVLNVSEYGYSPQEELIRLETTGFDLSGKVVVHFIFEGNDLKDSRIWRAWLSRRFKSDWPDSGLVKNLAGLLHAPSRKAAARRLGLFAGQGGDKKTWFLYDAPGMARQMKEFGTLEAVLAEARNEVVRKGGAYGVVFIPAKITVMHDACTWPAGSDFATIRPMEGPLGKALEATCADAGISFRSIADPLRALAARGISPYHAADTHLSSAGHEATAIYLEPWIRALRDLPPVSSP